ncbi:helix-turn-helix domain-containing protein [Bacillus mycoides]|uniref:helix-turn-helix domain-containing protein n=1 Tax=Bacillus mycoides TaxID=1405 RepID=UPI000BFBB373|nr:helix-turn-helix transcriptional regulator [Bacillus mycoides]MCQ6528994.1 helix-turn-helix domain-containing protein [Bacillus mycoides]PGT59603.1 transcriptional regulator [Bacillus cereus]PGV88210.1 transcriptional regulator [Bacillus cereus]
MIFERIKEIRKSKKFSREKFGEKIGVSRGVIENIEYNRVEIKDLYIQLICKEFNVNEHWLRTGEGEPYLSKNDEDELTDLMVMLTTTDDDILKTTINDMAKLPPEDIIVLKGVVDALLKKQKTEHLK